MKLSEKEIAKANRIARIEVWMAERSSRNKTVLDRICRFVLNRMTRVKPVDDFMRDPLIDSDIGYDPEELERFQNGER